jgi:sulfate/thiosulfate transport system permease protein
MNAIRFKRPSPLPGFGLTLGYTTFYLSLIVLIPLAGLFVKTAALSWSEIWRIATDRRAIASYRLTFGCAAIGAAVNVVFGFIVAWTLVRYRFPLRRFWDGLIDLPFALPTAVSGIALATIFSKHGWLGRLFAPLGIETAYSPLGITIALAFIGLPLVVRTVQPAIEELDPEVEEAAAVLGANRWQAMTRVIFPTIGPALLTGFALSFARAVGEYGSVIFIAGNKPFKTEITTLLIVTELEQDKYAAATTLAAVMLVVSFALLLLINLLQAWSTRGRQRDR